LHVTSAVERWHKFSFPFSAVPPSSTDRQWNSVPTTTCSSLSFNW
jgi:hypothetical protein